MAEPSHSPILEGLQATTDPGEWAGQFLAWWAARPCLTPVELYAAMSDWFAASLETGRHYGAKAALGAADPFPMMIFDPATGSVTRA